MLYYWQNQEEQVKNRIAIREGPKKQVFCGQADHNDDIISIRLKLHLMPPLDDPTLGQMADDACKIDAAACLEIIVSIIMIIMIIMTMEFIWAWWSSWSREWG